MPVLVLITGPPCTGKTTLGQRLASDFNLPFFFKDGFKERMYDDYAAVQGADSLTRDASRLLGRMSMGCLQIVCEEMLARNQSHILEANFDRQLFSPYLAELKTRYAFHVVQVQLKANGGILLERFVRREREDRHPGHQGLAFLESVKPALLRGEQEPLNAEGDLLTLDTTDFALLNYASIHALLTEHLGRTAGQA